MSDRRLVRVPHFGDIPVADGEMVVQDNGTLGVQGHSVRIGPGGQATWEKRPEGLEAGGASAFGSFSPRADELRELSTWADTAWELCERPKPPPHLMPGPPRWVWCVLVRRGNEARWLADRDHAPEELRPLLDWLTRRVDALADG